MKLVTREQWGAGAKRATVQTHPIGFTFGTSFHWEGSGWGTNWPHEQCARKVRAIYRYHTETKGWADIAYNFIVCPHGWVFEGRGIGVMSAANGWAEVNDDWYAVCYLGGSKDPFTQLAKFGFIEAVRYIVKNGGGTKVNGHRDHKSTTCPGDVIHSWLRRQDWPSLIENEGFTVTPEDEEKIRAIVQEVVDKNKVKVYNMNDEIVDAYIGTAFRYVQGDLNNVKATLKRIEYRLPKD